MKVAVFSDVHGNLPALERFVSATRQQVDSYLCLGDVVNYGPWNDECLEQVSQLPGIVLLEGNHERLFLDASNLRHEIPLVQAFYHHSVAFFKRKDLIVNLRTQVNVGGFFCQHTIQGRSVYADTAIAVSQNHIIGHTHHQYQIERADFTIINPGSVGQNRKWINRVEYLILDTDEKKAVFYSLVYDVDQFISELRVRHYPMACVNYYYLKMRKQE